MIAWVRLRWDGPGPVSKGYLWQVGRETIGGLPEVRARYRRGFTPFPFVFGDPLYKVLEEWFVDSESDHEIYQQIREGVARTVPKTTR